MTQFLKATAFAAALIPAAAGADSITLEAPMAGASLHAAGVDMSVYYLTLADGTYEVVATYAAQDDAANAQRLTMALRDGDAARFGLPGHGETLYAFERDGTDVTVRAAPKDRRIASNEAAGT